jgi:UDP-MurNAc hydroxylase
MLKFTFIGNACGIFSGKSGTRVLCDPWLKDGVFEGSWCHYPPLKTKATDVLDVDAVYVSHLHPDHFDERTFDFRKDMPLIVLDHGPNFLPKKLESMGYSNLVAIKDRQTIQWREFEITLYAPFVKHNFHEALVGNLIDSAMRISCDGVTAVNFNDNQPSGTEDLGPIDLAMLNYNAAGPYPACFAGIDKPIEHERILARNVEHMRRCVDALKPRFVLPFAGAYVLGGTLKYKNEYLGTTTWDDCAVRLGLDNVVCLREGDTLDIGSGKADRPYIPIDVSAMKRYVETLHAPYPYQLEAMPDNAVLYTDLETAAGKMQERMAKFGIRSNFSVTVNGRTVHPGTTGTLACTIDPRLLRAILDRRSHWNNAEIGCHVEFDRRPNTYEPDLHMALQFLHL